jgi:hypothetical protein
MAGISKRAPLFVIGAFCADIAVTSNRTTAMYFIEVPSRRCADLRSPSLNSIRESGTDQLTEGLGKHDFGYLQPISLKEENRVWATMCKLKQEKTECFVANVGGICPVT